MVLHTMLGRASADRQPCAHPAANRYPQETSSAQPGQDGTGKASQFLDPKRTGK
jgi:hypothetical protein